MAEVKPDIETVARIKVVGIGGGGGSALNRMIEEKLRGVEFIAVNTDAQAIHHNFAPTKIAIGKTVTRGLGAGMNPEMGKRAVEENASEIRTALQGADMVFITAGLGGGTGTGAAPEVAKSALEMGALTVAVVTKPFSFEGAERRRIAEEGHKELGQHVDAIITIPNDRVLQIIDKNTSWKESFKIIDDVLRQGVQGIAETITKTGAINVDFADVRAVMHNSGSALMGIGQATGEGRAIEAAKLAIASPLLEVSIDGAKGILMIVSSANIGMLELQEAAQIISGAASDDAKVIWGMIDDDSLGDSVRITVIATGFDHRDSRRASLSLGGETPIAPKGGWRQQAPAPAVESPFTRRSTPPSPQPPAAPFQPPQPPSQPQYVPPAPQPAPPQPQPQQASPQPSQDDETDLGIPAFIRRKMM